MRERERSAVLAPELCDIARNSTLFEEVTEGAFAFVE